MFHRLKTIWFWDLVTKKKKIKWEFRIWFMEVLMDNLQVHIYTDLLVLSSESSSNLGGTMRGILANVSENQNWIYFGAGLSSIPFLPTTKLNSYNLAFKSQVFFLLAVCWRNHAISSKNTEFNRSNSSLGWLWLQWECRREVFGSVGLPCLLIMGAVAVLSIWEVLCKTFITK